jgi:2-polyprenyl-3-methyl-5-hydroxy-6-metoxy-1,4-benzoquinol methylase
MMLSRRRTAFFTPGRLLACIVCVSCLCALLLSADWFPSKNRNDGTREELSKIYANTESILSTIQESRMGCAQNHERIFQYAGTHCTQNYTVHDLSEVFEAHKLEWGWFGKTEPWWSVLTDDRWKGMKDIPDKIKDEFYSSEIGISTVIKLLEKYGGMTKRNRALDFGSGVGRTALALKRNGGFKHVTGVDQSLWHIQTARKEIKRLGQDQQIKFVLSGVDMLLALRGSLFDFVFSIIALQHMIPPLMVAYIEQFCDSLYPGSHGFFQIPTKLLADYSQFKCDFTWSMKEGGMQVWYLERDEVVSILKRRSCRVLEDFDFDMIGIPQAESKAFFFEKL